MFYWLLRAEERIVGWVGLKEWITSSSLVIILQKTTKNICCSEKWWYNWSLYSNQMLQEIELRLQEPWYLDVWIPRPCVLQTINVNPENSIQRVSGELSISLFSVACHFHDLSKSIWQLPNCVFHTKIL